MGCIQSSWNWSSLWASSVLLQKTCQFLTGVPYLSFWTLPLSQSSNCVSFVNGNNYNPRLYTWRNFWGLQTSHYASIRCLSTVALNSTKFILTILPQWKSKSIHKNRSATLHNTFESNRPMQPCQNLQLSALALRLENSFWGTSGIGEQLGSSCGGQKLSKFWAFLSVSGQSENLIFWAKKLRKILRKICNCLAPKT